MSLRILLTILASIFWPTALILDSHGLPLEYFLPGLLTGMVLFASQSALLLIIPFISPKLALFPPVFFILQKKHLHALISFIIFLIVFPFGQTVFIPDYERRQEIIRNIHLYPNVFMARLYQNKGYIYLDKFTDNLTQLLDPNNYFFANHPRELRDNPNLPKFPYALIVFFFLGLFSVSISDFRLSALVISILISLSVLTVPSGHDFVLWPVICFYIFQGLKIFHSGSFRFKYLVYIIVSWLSLYEYMQLLINK